MTYCKKKTVFHQKTEKNNFQNAPFLRVEAPFLRVGSAVLPRARFSSFFLDQDVISKHRSLTVGSEMATELGSRVFSSDTLVKGAGLIRNNTMSLEHDEEYTKLMEERNRLLETWRGNTP